MNQEIRLVEDDDYDLDDDLPAQLDFDAIRAEAKRQGREYKGRHAGKGVRIPADILEFFKTPEAITDALREVMNDRQRAA